MALPTFPRYTPLYQLKFQIHLGSNSLDTNSPSWDRGMLRGHSLLGVILWGGFVPFALGSQLDSVDAGVEKTATIQRIEGELLIDGELDEPEWDLAQPVSDFIQRDPRSRLSDPHLQRPLL